jgi:hypothetical protein
MYVVGSDRHFKPTCQQCSNLNFVCEQFVKFFIHFVAVAVTAVLITLYYSTLKAYFFYTCDNYFRYLFFLSLCRASFIAGWVTLFYTRNYCSYTVWHFVDVKICTFALFSSFTWVKLSLIRREEHRLRVFENRVLTKIFAAMREEVAGGCIKLHKEERRISGRHQTLFG